MKKKICLIGNNNFGGSISDGQRIKVRTYLEVLEKEGFDIFFVELEAWKKRIFKTISSIKKGIKTCDIILIMAGPSGCRKIIPLVNLLNRKYKKRVVYSMIGTGTLSLQIKNKIKDTEVNDLFQNKNYTLVKDNRFSKHLKKMNIILAETDVIRDMYKNAYRLENCETMTNFRIISKKVDRCEDRKVIKLIYLSRVMKEKGIFDLISSINDCPYRNFALDIFGVLDLSEDESLLFYNNLNERIQYKGVLNPNDVIDTFRLYDLFIFPTRFPQEGVPGVIVESLLAGTPVLASDFGQAKSLLEEGVDSLIYDMYDVNDLKTKLFLFLDDDLLKSKLKYNAKSSGYKFTYEYNRNRFLTYITGDNLIW